MRCPKCHYLSFEPEARCRNCGYDLALADDLVIKGAADIDGPLQDFELRVPQKSHAVTLGPLRPAPVPVRPGADWPPRVEPEGLVATALKEPIVALDEAPGRLLQHRPIRPPSTTAELPLFMKGLQEPEARLEAPLVQVPAVPRAPLAVRRQPSVPPPDPVRAEPPRAERLSHVDIAAHLDSVWAPVSTPVRAEPQPHLPEVAVVPTSPTGAGLAARAVAGAIDLVLLTGIDVAVISLTARVCALAVGQVLLLSAVPLVTFMLLVDVGYLLLFTATSGQTLGKMAARLRVVDAQSPEALTDTARVPLTFRQAVVRSLVTVPSVVAFGTGFLPALGGERLALHDRLAHTRVVRA